MLFQVLLYMNLNKNALPLENVVGENIGVYSKTFSPKIHLEFFFSGTHWHRIIMKCHRKSQISNPSFKFNIINFVFPQQYLSFLDNLMPK